MLAKLFKRKAELVPALPAGARVYAIGDVHGRLDLLDQLLAMIDADDRSRSPAATGLILLGDLIDRGPDSAGVVERARLLARERPDAQFLMGNHEELFLKALDGDSRALRAFCRIGGRETIISYGVTARDFERMSYPEVGAALDELVPAEHVAFLRSFDAMVRRGDYVFVHAGVDPARPLDAQDPQDLRWIREPFLGFRGSLPGMVVHGHTIRPEVEFLPHRIGIDTGAYETGRLTALGLEDQDRWTMQT